jgi:adenylate kinase
VPAELLEKRATGRRSCPVCGEIYNIYFKPPLREGFCDFHPEAVLLQRADDTEDKIRVRLATYDQQTKPLINYYDKTGRLHRVNGTKDQETIHREITNILMSS